MSIKVSPGTCAYYTTKHTFTTWKWKSLFCPSYITVANLQSYQHEMFTRLLVCLCCPKKTFRILLPTICQSKVNRPIIAKDCSHSLFTASSWPSIVFCLREAANVAPVGAYIGKLFCLMFLFFFPLMTKQTSTIASMMREDANCRQINTLILVP